MAEDLLHVGVSHLEKVALLTVRGDIDADTVTALQAALDELDVDRTIQINMAAVRFMDSSGVNAILAHAIRMEKGQGSITICQPSTAVRRVVEIAGLEAVIFETQTKEALPFENHQRNGSNRSSVDALNRSASKGMVGEDVA